MGSMIMMWKAIKKREDKKRADIQAGPQRVTLPGGCVLVTLSSKASNEGTR